MKRQKIRKTMLILSLLLFPITMYYFSPYLIIDGAMQGIVSGSFLVFLLMILAGIFLGRAFCGHLCPMGGLQECLMQVNDAPVEGRKLHRIRYAIWGIWLAAIVLCIGIHGGLQKIEPLYMTDHGISISEIGCYVIYYIVLLLVVIPTILLGRRAFCHTFCWMSPFMILGMKIRKTLHLPALHVKADADKCIHCGRCSRGCPMSISVEKLVENGEIVDSECINCGHCVDNCKKNALSYTFAKEKEKANGKREKN